MSAPCWMMPSLLSSALVILSVSFSCQALLLPQAVSSNMVLQRAPQQARIWGWAAAGSTVTITMNSISKRVYVDSTGGWYYDFPPQMTSTGHIITITGDGQTITLSNIAFGDVFICSGQSNMEIPLADTFDAASAIPDSAKYPNLRLFSVSRRTSLTPLNDTINRWNDSARWVVSQPKYVDAPKSSAALYFSAVCYYFGRELYKALNGTIPIGLVESCYGGTRIEAWTTPEGLAMCGPTVTAPEDVDSADESSAPNPITPSVLFNAMIAPITNMRVTGVTWYQAEDNKDNATNYACRFPALINDWRQQFNNFHLNFYFVLLAAYKEGGFPAWPLVRQAQLSGLNLPFTGVASAHDLGDEHSSQGAIHPRNKTIVGARLALNAQAQMYGQNVVYRGPSIADIIWPIHTRSNATVILRFRSDDPSSRGLHLADTSGCTACCKDMSKGSPIQLITSDGLVHRALVTVMPSSYIVIATLDLKQNTTDVTAIWLNWEVYSECALYNSANIPHLPFNIAKP